MSQEVGPFNLFTDKTGVYPAKENEMSEQPFGYIGADACTLISGGEQVTCTFSPVKVCDDDVPLFTAQADQQAQPVKEGESLWLIETSARAQLDGPQRHFWDGRGWNWDALKAARYPMRDSALDVVGYPDGDRYYLGSVHRNDIQVCEHLFQCGIASPPAPQADQQAQPARELEDWEIQEGWKSEGKGNPLTPFGIAAVRKIIAADRAIRQDDKAKQ